MNDSGGDVYLHAVNPLKVKKKTNKKKKKKKKKKNNVRIFQRCINIGQFFKVDYFQIRSPYVLVYEKRFFGKYKISHYL